MQKYLVPRPGLLVRDPSNYTPLPINGMFVDWNGNAGRFWRRRVKCGDASIGEPKKEITESKGDLKKEAESETTSNRRQRGK